MNCQRTDLENIRGGIGEGERLTGDTDEIERGVTDKLLFPAGVEDFLQQLIGQQKIDPAGGVRIRRNCLNRDLAGCLHMRQQQTEICQTEPVICAFERPLVVIVNSRLTVDLTLKQRGDLPAEPFCDDGKLQPKRMTERGGGHLNSFLPHRAHNIWGHRGDSGRRRYKAGALRFSPDCTR